MVVPKDLQGKELFTFLKENKEDLLWAKKQTFKKADALSVISAPLSDTFALKEEGEDSKTEIKVRAIINTTNVIDSHKDVHIDGIWNKSMKENRSIKHLQEHEMKFDKIIADKDDLEVSVNSVTWKSLGFDFEGKTEALTFDSTIKAMRNPTMFKEYSDKNVDNHSVGMQYVKLALAINSDDEDYVEEKAVWDKHYNDIANKGQLEKSNYFWAVYEAKAIEGSAVVMGSNSFTPTQNTKTIEVKTDEEIEKQAIMEWLGGKAE